MMQYLNLDYLRGLCQIFVDFGGWAVSVFLGLFIMYLLRKHEKSKRELDKWWKEERIIIGKKFDDHHEDIKKMAVEDNEFKGKLIEHSKNNARQTEAIARTLERCKITVKPIEENGLTQIFEEKVV